MSQSGSMNSAVDALQAAVPTNIAPDASQGALDATPDTKFRAGGSANPDHGHPSRSYSRAERESSRAPVQSVFLPMLLGSLALLGWLGFQTFQMLRERQALQMAYASQQQTVDNAAKLRGSLDAIAADTQRLADSGNPNAKLLVDELRKRGITISTTAKADAPAVKP